uniref:Uncharacterized protein n=1 Tax=Phytophthora fragariae TaxID=53985 RepID=A0A6A3DYV7_9STRA|nr:hypothetical protein PF009_g24290 [Phytophthora fragariae]
MKKRGIHGAFIQEICDILLGCGPKKCRKVLQNRYAEVPKLSALLPGPGQLKNHKSHLKSALAGGWEIKNIAKLLEWAFPRLYAGVFYTVPSHFRNELMVLEYFEHDVQVEGGKKATCFRLVITSRQIFRNMLYAHNGQKDDGVIGVTDGTYRIHFGVWTLVDFGTYKTHYDRNMYSNIYLNSLIGKLPRDATVFNAQLYFLSLHHVRLAHLEKLNGLTATPKFAAAQGNIKIASMLETLPVRKSSGGQRKQKNCLAADSSDSHQFSVDVLTRDLLRHPLYPVNWTVMKEFPMAKDDINGPSHYLQGKVTSWGERHGRYYWLFKFSDLRRLQVDCNTLAELLHDAYIHGADMTGPIFFEPEPHSGEDMTEASI